MFESKSTAPNHASAHSAAPLLERASEQAGALAHRSADAMRETTEHLRRTALRASNHTADYVRDAPVKSLFIAAAAGALLAALITLATRSSGDRH